MKRPLLFLFAFTVLGIFFLYPRSYEPDPVFAQGLYYSVSVTGRLQTYSRRSDRTSLTLTDCQIQHNDQTYQCSQLLVTMEGPDICTLQAGNHLLVKGSLSSFQPARNPGNFDWYAYYRSRHISYRVYADQITVIDPDTSPLHQYLLTLREDLALQLQQLCDPDTETAALLTALLLGDKNLLEEDTKSKYEDGGILHILTVSGLHISLLGTAVFTLCKRLYLPPCLRGVLSSLLVFFYCQLCGSGMSAGRAFLMFICLTAAPLMGRTYDSLSALSLAGILLLWNSPMLLFQSGFQLSFGAVLGIQLICPAFSPPKETHSTAQNTHSKKTAHDSTIVSLLHRFLSALLFGLGLQLTLLPITLYHFFRYPLYSLLLNLVILPLTGPLFLLGASGLLVAELLPLWGPDIASHLLMPCQWILRLYDMLCELALSLPHASSLLGRPDLLRIFLYYAVLALFCLWQNRRQSKNHTSPAQSTASKRHELWPLLWPLLTGPLLALLLLPLPQSSLRVTFLDVGQGDCALIQTPSGTTILIDSGSSDIKAMADYRLIPFLESKGIDHLDYVFLSHTDEDHINGIADWLEIGGTIGTAILPALSDTLTATPSYQQTIDMLTSYQTPLHFFSQGMSWQENELILTCLAPVDPFSRQSALYQSLNTASQVLMLQYQGIRILFTGDCEEEGEALLLSYLQENDLTCHILKAGHHGSTYATSQALLTQLQPQAVIVSCGIHNRYGHPHPTMLDRVESTGAICHVTASCGAVSVMIRRGKATVQTQLTTGPLYYR